MSTAGSTGAVAAAVDQALGWMIEAQSHEGEIPSFASPLEGEPVWVPDSLKFITALAAVALDELDDPRAASVVDRAVNFLLRERETCAQWRYWSQDNEQFDFTPPDADDTACASMAVATRGHHTGSNVAVLMGSRDPSGRFYTWLIPHSWPADPRRAWALRDEFRSLVRRRREELWATTEADPDDVDGVVNTNVIRYLGRRAPEQALSWVRSLVDQGREDDCDKWHRNRYTLYAAIADAVRRGVRGLEPLGPTIVQRVDEQVDDDGSVGPAMDTALALLAVQVFDGPAHLRAALSRSLLERQQPDGAWERSIFYYGGPKEVFGWASEALTTAWCLQALHREQRTGATVR